jgi:thioredoxin-dependent peroxiredoxin
MAITLGKKVADFTATATNGPFKLSAHKGKNVVLYFYPKDSTPGCTTQGGDFRDAKSALDKANTIVFGVSRDSVKSHSNFKTKMEFNFELISDPEEALCTEFEVMKMKNMYGKQVRGIERSTFVIDATGKLVKEMRGVKVPGHVAEVVAFVQTL